MSRTMPLKCKHGVCIDWGDFGPPNVWGDACPKCGVDAEYGCEKCWCSHSTLEAARSCECGCQKPPP